MTISSATNKVQISSGSTITITDLEAQDTSQVLVTKTDTTTTPATETTLVLTTDYTIDTDITTVTLNVALAAGEEATATLNVGNTQGTDYKNASPLNAETVETALDKLTLKNKQQQDEIDRSIKFVVSETAGSGIEAPDPVSGDGDKYWKWNDDFTAIEYSTLSSTAGLGNVAEDTTPQLGGDLDANGSDIQFDDATGIRDDSDNEQLIFQKTASAVNHVEITNAATGGNPLLAAVGDDSNVDLDLRPKGTGNVTVGDGTDPTKEISFESSGATTAKTLTLSSSHTDNRTITFPDTTDTLVGKATTDTLTNKTLTSPTLTTPALGTPSSGVLTNCTGYPSSALPAGTVIQVVNTSSSAVATGTTLIPNDDTIPQSTEGDEYITRAITPTNSSNKLKIEASVILSSSAAVNLLTAALFQDSTADALAAASQTFYSSGQMTVVSFIHYMTAGTTSSTTFKIRGGGSVAGTTTFNGVSGGRKFGGVISSSITITEIQV